MATPIDVLSASLPALVDDLPGGTAVGSRIGLRRGLAPRPADTVRAWRAAQWREALLGLPLDERTYADRFEITRQAEIERLWRWWCAGTPAQTPPETVGYLGFYLLTVVAMHCSDRMRFHGDRPDEIEVAGTTSDVLCRALVADPRVQAAIAALYDPLPPADDLTLTEWQTIDVGSLAFHRQGTTSLILTGQVARPSRGRAAKFALKLVIYPYLTVPAITSATRDYLTDHGSPTGEHSPAVTVWASHGSWILMDFVPGRTLAECLAERSAGRPSPSREIDRPVDVQQLELLGGALLHGLAELEAEGRRHGDLSPSNIIVQGDAGSAAARVRFVDLGVNHLHTQSLAGSVQGETTYVAPEVRSTGVLGDRADLYSLGMLLIAAAGIPHSAPGTVPDQFYVASAGMARLLEDLVDAEPARRLLVSRIDRGSNRFEQVGALFRDEVEVLRESEPDDDGWLQAVRRYAPGAGTMARQRRIWRVRSAQARRAGAAAGAAADAAGPTRDHLSRAHLHRARRLRFWAVLCAVGLWSTTALVLTWWARDLGLDWQARWFDVLNQVTGRSGAGLVFFDDVRDYPIPDPWGNLPSRLVALTTALVSARIYLGVLADLSPSSGIPRHGMLRVRTVVAAIAVRSPAVVPALCVLLPTLVQRDWWPLATQVFVVWIYLVISASLWFAHDANRRARAVGLSTVPAGEIPTLARFEAWHSTLIIYAVVVLLVGALIQLGLLQDELAYAAFASVVNVAIWYFKSGVTDAPLVRAGLSRAILAAERLDHLATGARRDTPGA